jgi:phospholipase C
MVALAACGGGPAAGRTAKSTPAPEPAGSVFVVVMENRGYAEALSNASVSALARESAVATNYHAVAHPSLPNYLALTSGSTYGIADDRYHALPLDGIGEQLSKAGVTWKAYMEDMAGDCLNDNSTYAVKHNPFAYYGGTCPSNVVPMTRLANDLRGGTPRFVWISPNLCHDGHDCPPGIADSFLGGLVSTIRASAAWRHGGLLIVTWDEDDGGHGNQVLTLAVAPGLTHREVAQAYDHYSLLAAVEDRLGVPRLGAAAAADPLTDLLKAG